MTHNDETFRRGEVWLANLDEITKEVALRARLVMIVSTNRFNNGPADLLIVLPLTTRDHGIASHVKISPPEGGANKQSFILCEHIQSIQRDRLIKKLGIVGSDTIKKVDDRLCVLLDLFAPN